jgi:EpsD family peptidyl-prolyl cis-trans isomerase
LRPRASENARLRRSEADPMKLLPSPPFAPTLHRAALVPVALGVALLAAGCGERKDRAVPEVAARVNKDEIALRQVQAVQQQRGLRLEQADPAGRQILERLIDQQLVLQKADELQLERDPLVAQQVEAARREALVRAYVDKVGEAAVKPTPEDVRRYYDEKPALFAQRRIYSLQEITIEARPDQLTVLREQLAGAKTIGEFLEYLKADDFRFGLGQAVRAAEQLPPASLEAIARLQDGQAIVTPASGGVLVLVRAGSREQPVTLEQARPAIEQFILNDRRRKLVEDDMKSLRAAAKIEYLGRFAAGAASAPAAAASR